MRNILLVISGPSGGGKGTIARKIVESDNSVVLSISCTTRSPRKNEKHGREYFFITKSEFEEKIENDGFLEYSNHFENYYGTPKEFVLEKLKTNDVILEIDVNGGLEVKKSFKDAVLVMITPPSYQEVVNRLNMRHTESPEKIKLRLERMAFELDKQSLYDYSVVNDKIDLSVKAVKEIIEKEKNK